MDRIPCHHDLCTVAILANCSSSTVDTTFCARVCYVFGFPGSENGPSAPFRGSGGHCGLERVLSVAWSVSVYSARECRIDLFCAVSESGTMRSLTIKFQRSRLWRQASLQPADLSIAHFREHPTAVSPRSLMHVGAICGIGRSWMSSFLKKSKGERSGRHGS